jgi:hypothetical protein
MTIVMRGANSPIRCDGMIVTRFISSSTSGGSGVPASIGNPRFTTA